MSAGDWRGNLLENKPFVVGGPGGLDIEGLAEAESARLGGLKARVGQSIAAGVAGGAELKDDRIRHAFPRFGPPKGIPACSLDGLTVYASVFESKNGRLWRSKRLDLTEV